MRVRTGDKVVYVGEPQGFDSDLGSHKAIWPGTRGMVRAVDRNTARVEFVIGNQAGDFMVSVFDLQLEVFRASSPVKQGFWKSVIGIFNG